MIAKLEELKEKYGDLEIKIEDYNGGHHIIDGIKPPLDKNHNYYVVTTGDGMPG